MRKLALIPLLLLGACSVENDDANDTISVGFDANAVEETAEDLGNAAEDAAGELGSAAENAGEAIESEVDNLDVDVDINRNKADEKN